MPQQPLPEATPLPTLYLNITELPLRNFIDCACDQNLAALIRSGLPTQEALIDAWQEIQAQYSEAMGNHKQRLMLNLYRQIVRIQNTLFQIGECVKVLRNTYCKEFAALLNELVAGSCKFDTRFPEDYEKDLKQCVSRSKAFKINLDMKLMQYAELQKEEQGGEAATRAGFAVTLIALSNHAHYPVTDSVTVFEYVTRIKQLNEYAEQVNRQKK